MPVILSALTQLSLQAVTPAAGLALVNGTPNILTWNAPNDGRLHRAIIIATQTVASLETGGQVSQSYTLPGGAGGGDTLFTGGSGTGTQVFFIIRQIQAGTALTVNQATALTGGVATVWAEIWGS